MKIGEKQRTMLLLAQTQYSMLSAMLHVCLGVCVMSGFRILHCHFTR